MEQIKNIYGLVGLHLVHSFSENFFNQKFESEEINAKYVNFEIPHIDDFKRIIENNSNLNGLNVTIPYKEQIIPFLDEIDSTAKEIGAINVIKFITNHNGVTKLKGYNTDVIGFYKSIKPLLKPIHTHALILGTGGAAKAIAHGLKTIGLKFKFVSRTPNNEVLSYKELTPIVMDKYKVIINTTPLGMYPNINSCPNIPYEFISTNHICYDLTYNPDITLFLKKSKEQGATIKNGLEMLILQAEAAWEIWQQKIQ
ncbi:MAG: shikimate dehydrogenase [Bacteroidales bacterium]|nr:shikimate dehydrogenase [Bacteroidales bacterium]